MPTDVNRGDVRRLIDDGATLLEVLPAKEFQAEHLPGAINLPRDRPIVVYCDDAL